MKFKDVGVFNKWGATLINNKHKDESHWLSLCCNKISKKKLEDLVEEEEEYCWRNWLCKSLAEHEKVNPTM